MATVHQSRQQGRPHPYSQEADHGAREKSRQLASGGHDNKQPADGKLRLNKSLKPKELIETERRRRPWEKSPVPTYFNS